MMKRLAVGLLVLSGVASAGDWRDSITPRPPVPFAGVPPLTATYRIGWMEIAAAHADVDISYSEQAIVLHGRGGTTGFARSLYQLDGTLHAHSQRETFQTLWAQQVERYTDRILMAQMAQNADGFWSLREKFPNPGNPSTWRRINQSPIYDLFSGLLFIRSQPLAIGDSVSTVIFPGDAAFLVNMKVLKAERLTIADKDHDTLKLNLDIQRINLKKGGVLEPHKKFRSGTIWLSNDATRIPLRVEVNIFVGYVFAEIESLKL